MTDLGLDYVPGLIAAYRAGFATDHMHLGYWPDDEALDWPAAQNAMMELHLDALALRDGLAITDIGCGLGGSLRVVNGRFSDCTLTGVNIDPRQLAVCRETHPQRGNRLHWVQADAAQTTLADDSQDVVVSLEAMFHFPSRKAFLKEACRILRPDGLLVCSDILFSAPQSNLEDACLSAVTKGYAPWPQPVKEISIHHSLAAQAGFQRASMLDISAQVLPTWRHIVSSRDDPLSSPRAAMKALHEAGRLHYIVSHMRKPGDETQQPPLSKAG